MSGSRLTRRRFLQQLGAIGGSSLVFGAMDAWALNGKPAGPKPQLRTDGRHANVLVLGAGLTGLAVAYELGKLGYTVQVLEARDRVGGVSHTIRRGTTETEIGTGETQTAQFDEGLYFNSGPWRIPNAHKAVLDYCKELGVPLQVFINEHDAAPMYFEGEEFGALSGKKMTLREVKADMRGFTSELLAKAIDQKALDLPMTEEDAELLVRYLVGEGYLGDDHGYVGSEARGPGAPHDPRLLLRSGLASRIRSVDPLGNTRAPMFQPIGGMDQIPVAFARVLGDKITRNTEVLSIAQGETGVKVVTLNTVTGAKQEMSADYVVSCIPLTVLRTIPVNVSAEMQDAIKNVNYSNSAKIGVQMRRRFWEDDEGIYGGAAYTNLPLGQFAYPSNDLFSQKGILLGFYGSESVGGIGELSVAGRIQHVLDHSSKFHPQIKQEFETGYAKFWSKIKYSNGAYASSPRGDMLAKLTRPEGRIFLGCAAAGDNPSWMEGAFAAAWGAVERLHATVMA